MVKGFCRVCGSWENLHKNGLCHVHNYGHEEGRAFPTAPTPEAVARELGGGNRQLVDVEFGPGGGTVLEAKRREATEAEARAANEPILGKLTAEGRKVEESTAIDRTGPEDVEEAKAAALANVEGLRRDVDEMENPPKVSEIDPKQAGDADLKSAVRTDTKDEAAEEKPTRQRGAATTARDAGKEKK